jgi:hypothetical protein
MCGAWSWSKVDDLTQLTEKILATIRLDVTNIHVKASGSSVLPPEYQEALTRYYKLLTDARLASKEKQLEEALQRAEAALSSGQTQKD